MTHTFAASEPLAAVRLYVGMNNADLGEFTFMTTFPRKVYTDEDMEKPLSALGESLLLSKSFCDVCIIYVSMLVCYALSEL